jgi:protein-S-isoprenylcysteine O-methyltransferase Ste14
MSEQSVEASPWWYRHRGITIGVIFGLGFCIGNIQGTAHLPAPAIAWAGVALVLAAWLVRLSGTAYLHGDVVFAADVQRDRLIVAGPFRYVRNPLYLGNDLMAAGVGLYAAPLGFVIIVLGNIVFGIMLANEEDRELDRHYGADYAAYRAAVPAFVPRLTPVTFPGRGEVKPQLRSAVMSESFTLVLGLAMIPIAVAGKSGVVAAAIIFVVAMALFIIASRAGRR